MTDFRQRFVFVFPDRAARRRFPHRIGNRDAGEVPAAWRSVQAAILHLQVEMASG